MKFSSDVRVLAETLQLVMTANEEIVAALYAKNAIHYDTYMDIFLFYDVFSVEHNKKRLNAINSRNIVYNELEPETVKVKNDEYCWWKEFIALFPFTKDYDVPHFVEVLTNGFEIEMNRERFHSEKLHVENNARALKREWKEYKGALAKRKTVRVPYISPYGNRDGRDYTRYGLRLPNNIYMKNINTLEENTAIIFEFSKKISLAAGIESTCIELSNDDIILLTNIVNYSAEMRSYLN